MAANTITLDQVQPEHVTWLWPGRIPFGKLTVFDGDPGLGKSLITLDLAARVTTGRGMPDGSPTALDGPAAVVLLTVEDGLADTIRPRLDLAGADSRLVTAITGIPTSDGYERGIVLPDDWQLVFDVVEATGAKLLILDPLVALLGEKVNSYRDQDIRRALSPGVRFTEDTDAALVVVRHLNKGSGTSAIYRGGGSIGISGAARSVLLVAKDPEDLSESRRIVASVKNNLAAPSPALAYHVESGRNGHPYIVWEGQTTHTANGLLATVSDADDQRAARDEAKDFLTAALEVEPLPVKDVFRHARTNGISERTLRRAADDMGIVKNKHGFGGDTYWTWELPKMATSPEDAHQKVWTSSVERGHLREPDQVLCRVCQSPLPTPADRERGVHTRCEDSERNVA